MRRQICLSFLLSLMGCSLATNRTYLTEMEHDDSGYFTPQEDFPVVAGDTGKYEMSDKERRKRTPSSLADQASERNRRSLDRELKSLESGQSEEALNFYLKYKHQLATTSERIYFLKLPHRDRRDYLESRGIIEAQGPVYTPHEKMFAARQSDILLGMSKDEVMGSWGRPLQVEVAGNPSYENERWLYNVNGATKYIYFESGRVEGWE